MSEIEAGGVVKKTKIVKLKKGTNRGSEKGFGLGAGIVLAAGALAYLFAFGGLDDVQNAVSPTPPPTLPPVEVDLFPEEVRNGDDYIGLSFVSEISNGDVFNAFIQAAARWSAILSETEYQNVTLDPEEKLCSRIDDVFFPGPNPVDLDHLIIIVNVTDIDGPGKTLGRAGPCKTPSGDVRRAQTGQMEFDIADIANLGDSLESVILHEMGHVLGIGTLWLRQNPTLLTDNIYGIDNSFIQKAAQPKYNGASAVAEYNTLLGVNTETFIPVENRIEGGVEQVTLETGGGLGSADGHWDNEFMNGELMEFQIDSGAQPPLSRVSIGSLEDMGYAVDYTLADFYANPQTRSAKSLRGGETKKTFYMVNDMLPPDEN